MKISGNWLKDYVHFSLPPHELADKLTHAGLVVAGIQLVEDDFCLDIEVTSNRPDCLGIIGIAREIAALTGGALQLPEVNQPDENKKTSETISVTVEEPLLCPRYTAQVIKEVTIKSSPEWMQKRLISIGLRPVNNIADITNYVMMETGQPLHAFDLDKLSGNKVVVRKAEAGEEFIAINGAQRALFHDMLIIADEKNPIAIAGIMGGKESEVSESTRNIFLECAQFESRQVRRTSKAVGIASDSSYRFERGTDPEGICRASHRAIQLIQDLAGGKVSGNFLDIKTRIRKPKIVTLRINKLNQVLGTNLNADRASGILKQLQFTILAGSNHFLDVEIPSFREEIYREIDLIEEVGRIYGYNNIPTNTSIRVRGNARSKREIIEDTVRNFFTGTGFYEVKTFSIVDTSPLQAINLWSNTEGFDIANPLRQEESRLRTSLLPSLIKVKKHNMNHGTERIKIFEIAKVYIKTDDRLPQEKTCLSFLDCTDFFTGKGIIEALLSHLGIPSKPDWTGYSEKRLFQEGRAARILMDETTIGYLGDANRKLECKTSIVLCEFDMDFLVKETPFTIKYNTVIPYPPAFRDLGLIVKEETTWASIEKCIASTQTSFLAKIRFLDIYRGKQVPEGKKSVSLNLCFQAHDRTLKSEDIDTAVEHMLKSLYKNLGAELRKL
ncbi:MAG: phenylalanine--tRNA ligase subunit beta [Candidatus Brocadiaceae bacterium]|nr:phenylalanine--tRNA ligase subunit beta [Candidatus Brocadiaceae bacterium]